jgi:hypothetical protein
MGKAAFFDPLVATFPESLTPPTTTMESTSNLFLN